jgi:hypothetical protein
LRLVALPLSLDVVRVPIAGKLARTLPTCVQSYLIDGDRWYFLV